MLYLKVFCPLYTAQSKIVVKHCCEPCILTFGALRVRWNILRRRRDKTQEGTDNIAWVSRSPQLGQLTIDPFRNVLNCDLPVSGGQVQLVTRHNKGDFLIVRPLLSDLLETTLDAVERCSWSCGVDQQERMRSGNAEAPHCWKLHVPSRVQYINLKHHATAELEQLGLLL